MHSETKPELEMTTRINLAALAAVSKFTSTDDTRYYLQGVCLEIEPRAVTYVATDGHRCVAHREAIVGDDPDNDLTGTFIVPTAQCREHKFKKKDPAYGLLSGDNKRLTLEFDGLGISFQPIDGTFPDWRLIVPRFPLSGQPGQFNGLYAADFSKFSQAMGFGSLCEIAHNGQANPGLVRFPNHPDTIGVIMPFRGSVDMTAGLPEWAIPARRMQAAE